MTAFKAHGKGSLVLDMRFKGLGRICKSSGTDNPGRIELYKEFLRELERHGRMDLLRAWKDGRIHISELYQAGKDHGLRRIPSFEGAKRLNATIDQWNRLGRDGEPLAPQTVRDYLYAFDAVTKGKDRPLVELPKALLQYKQTANARMFNLARSACQSLVRETLGRYSDVWREISEIHPRRVVRKTTSGLTPEKAREIAEKLGRYGPMWWTLCCTGMRRGEYWSRWEVSADRIMIHGTKSRASERFVPRICTPVRPMILYPAFQKKLKVLGVTSHDGRRTFMHWMERASIDESRRQFYIGHSVQGVSGLYLQHNAEPYVDEDRVALLALRGEDPRHLSVMK